MDALFDVPATAPLPELQGSEAQRKWAEDVRRGKLRECRLEVWRIDAILRLRAQGDEPQTLARRRALELAIESASARLAWLEAQTDAHWWIEARERTAGVLLGLEEG